MKKKIIFKVAGAVIGGIILILFVTGFVYYKVKIAPSAKIWTDESQGIFSDKQIDIYYYATENEKDTRISKLIVDKYGSIDNEKATKAITNMVLSSESKLDSKDSENWDYVFKNHCSMVAVEPGYYVVYFKELEVCSVLFLQYDKKLLKIYGKTMKAADLEKSWMQEFSM